MSTPSTESDHRHVDEYEMPSAEVSACPYPYYKALRAEAPVYKYPGRNEYIVSRHADIVKVVKDTELFSNAAMAEDSDAYAQILGKGSAQDCPAHPGNMFFTDPPEHKLKRSL